MRGGRRATQPITEEERVEAEWLAAQGEGREGMDGREGDEEGMEKASIAERQV